jgi:hypothetical protein
LAGIWKTNGNGQSLSIIGPIIGLVIAVSGVISAFLAGNHDAVLIKGGTSTVTFKHILFGKAKSVSFETTRVQSVFLMTQYTNNANNNVNNQGQSLQKSSQLLLMLDDNSLIQIASSISSSSSSVNGLNVANLVTRAPLSKQANQIAQFLGVPLQSSGGIPSVGQVFHDIEEVVHKPVEQSQSIVEQPSTASQIPAISPTPNEQPVAPNNEAQTPDNTNWQN